MSGLPWAKCPTCNRPEYRTIFGQVEYKCGQLYSRQTGEWFGRCGLADYPVVSGKRAEILDATPLGIGLQQ